MPHNLCVPSLRTLILALPVYAGYRYNIDWTAFNWTFPALQHLSVDQTGYSESFIIDIFPPFPVFYERLLERHQEQIVSLRLDPPYPELSNVNSLVAWMKFPRLEAFATNFEQKLFATMPTTKEDLQMAGLPDQPIPLAPIGLRHLVQISHKDLNIKPIILGLVRCIEICAGLETITLPGAILKMLHKYHKVAADFKGLCEERNLKILNRDGEAVSLPLNTVSS
ncbi:hypothetical protein CPB86DRAFT_816592 [Serendipita vermifera]|nr:hypothetical protein CPB86DRAFT_816592 [Serendipita vermifera]